MEDNKDMVGSTETEQKAVEEKETSKESSKKEEGKSYSRDEVNRMINAEKEKVRKELETEFQTKQSEAERLAKMDKEEKLQYEHEQLKKELEEERAKNNSLTLKAEATTYANSKGLPIGYIEDWDFTNANAEDVKTRIDNLTTLRTKDIESALNERLKQKAPKEVGEKEAEDPYLKGYKDYMKRK